MIDIRELGLRQGDFALSGISFAVPTGKFSVLMGKTGCGKTSILEAIAGLRTIESGRVTLGTTDVTEMSPAARGIGYVPQDAVLFPTMTVRQHLAFALMIRQTAAKEMSRRVAELSDWLGIAHLLERFPIGLSGGESQRVALGRALSFRPRYLLMDEPLSSLDESTRAQMIELLRDLRNRSEVTVLHVTHSRSEADLLAEVLFRIEDGRVCREGF